MAPRRSRPRASLASLLGLVALSAVMLALSLPLMRSGAPGPASCPYVTQGNTRAVCTECHVPPKPATLGRQEVGRPECPETSRPSELEAARCIVCHSSS